MDVDNMKKQLAKAFEEEDLPNIIKRWLVFNETIDFKIEIGDFDHGGVFIQSCIIQITDLNSRIIMQLFTSEAYKIKSGYYKVSELSEGLHEILRH